MIIFLDTNIFFNNWHLKNANFKLLFNYVANTDSTILISEIVCDEINNKYRQAIQESHHSLTSALGKYQRLFIEDLKIEIPKGEDKYNFRNVILSKTEHLIIYGYENISNSTIVTRAIKKVKPFQEEDKGFRDTLIWLSFLDYLKSRGIKEDITFINNNSSDFYNDKKSDFNDDLKKDIAENEITNNFSVFKDLYSFVTSIIDKSKHTFTIEEITEEIIGNNERTIEIELEYFINQLTPIEIVELFGRSSEQKKALSYASTVKFEIVEGIEDLYLSNYEILKDNNLIFLELEFNLRLVEIEYSLPTIFYKEHLEPISTRYYNQENVGDNTKFYDFLRIEFNISFTFNKEFEEVQDLVINNTNIMK